MALQGICLSVWTKGARVFPYESVCVSAHAGFNKAGRIIACMFHVHTCAVLLAFLTMRHPAGRHPTVCSTLIDTHADVEQTSDSDWMLLSAQMAVNRMPVLC